MVSGSICSQDTAAGSKEPSLAQRTRGSKLMCELLEHAAGVLDVGVQGDGVGVQGHFEGFGMGRPAKPQSMAAHRQARSRRFIENLRFVLKKAHRRARRRGHPVEPVPHPAGMWRKKSAIGP